jgi:hypothetical protein
MAEAPRRKLEGIVPHPRYGDAVIPSGTKAWETDVRAWWRYHNETIFPESAIEADLGRQNYSTCPRRYYVDILKNCRTCNRPFLFFAREQQYWYDELGFYIESDCVLCPQCRVSDQELRRKVKRFSERISRTDLSDREFATLIGDTVFVWNVGYLRQEQKLRRLRNQARKRIPGYAETKAINDLVDSLGKQDG